MCTSYDCTTLRVLRIWLAPTSGLRLDQTSLCGTLSAIGKHGVTRRGFVFHGTIAGQQFGPCRRLPLAEGSAVRLPLPTRENIVLPSKLQTTSLFRHDA